MSFDESEISFVDLSVNLDDRPRFEGARSALCRCGHRFDAHRPVTYGSGGHQVTRKQCDTASCPCEDLRLPKVESKAVIIGGRR